MHVSLSELEATLAKAASGVGLPLGVGQDAGRAARWLAGNGHDPVPAVVDALDALDRGRSSGFDARKAIGGSFAPNPGSGGLSSLRAGPSACDLLLSAAQKTVTLEAVDAPGVILMLAGAASRGTAGALRLSWQAPEGAAFETVCQDGQFHTEQSEAEVLSSPGPATMTLTLADRQPLNGSSAACDAQKEGARVDEAAWRHLAAFASRCLVEATEASRLTGAGAGVVDTD